MKYTKQEAINLLGLVCVVSASMLKSYPGVDVELPVLDVGSRGVVDSLFYTPDGIVLGVLFDGSDLVELDKTQFEQHCHLASEQAA